MWLALAVGFFKRYNLLKNAMWQLIIVTVGCLIWDWLTGWHGWSIDFVLPGVSGLIMISMLDVYKRQVFLIIIRIGGQMKNVREYRKSVHILRFRSETASG